MNISTSAIIVHGGAGSTEAYQDGCDKAAKSARDILEHTDSALEAAISAVVAMEDDGRFNAGRGAIFCLDGETVETDAAVMDSTGRLGAVACLQRVRNPVLVAKAVAATPHWLLAGDGAQRFARCAGFADYYAPSDQAREQYKKLIEEMRSETGQRSVEPYAQHWNYAISWSEAVKRHGSGTVGTVVRGPDGSFAVATSTGGCTPALLGRVGDTPIVGCGFYAGSFGAIAATGQGEMIVRNTLARTVYQWIEQGMPLKAALDRGIALFNDDISVGLIGVTRDEIASSSNRPMASAVR